MKPPPTNIPVLPPDGYLTPERKKIARVMRSDGYSCVTIARRLGVTRQCISQHTQGVVKAGARDGW